MKLLFLFFDFPEADNPLMGKNYLTQPLILKPLLRLHHGLLEMNWIQRWGRDGADEQRCHPGVKVHTFTVMVYFLAKCMKILPGDQLIIRSLDLRTLCRNIQKPLGEGW